MAEVHRRAFDLARRYETPLFMFSTTRLVQAVSRFRGFVDRLPMSGESYYSYKTNYLPAMCQILRDEGIGAEVTSPVEWDLASRFHAPDRIVVNGLGKCAHGFLGRIVADPEHSPRLVNLETDTEVDLVLRRALSAVPLRVGLRVTLPGHPGEYGRDPSERWRPSLEKFGWNIDGPAVIAAAGRLAASTAVRVDALHVHFGSQVVSAARYDSVLQRVLGLVERLRGVGVTVSTLDIGGGIASGWVEKRRTGPLFNFLGAVGLRLPGKAQTSPDLNGIAAAVGRHAARLTKLGVATFLFEPGRFLAEPAMLAVAQVVAVRRDGERRHAVLNIGTNSLKCWRANETRPVVFDTERHGDPERIELVGPLCHPSDTFGTVVAPGPVQAGDLVCFDAVGAYTLGDWIANAWVRPAVYAEDGTLLWAAQHADDLLRPGEVDHAR